MAQILFWNLGTPGAAGFLILSRALLGRIDAGAPDA
jgi:hypothetical protein